MYLSLSSMIMSTAVRPIFSVRIRDSGLQPDASARSMGTCERGFEIDRMLKYALKLAIGWSIVQVAVGGRF